MTMLRRVWIRREDAPSAHEGARQERRVGRTSSASSAIFACAGLLLSSSRALAQDKEAPHSSSPTSITAPSTSASPTLRSSDAGPTERTPAAAPKGSQTPDREQAAAAAFEQAISLYAKGDVKGSLESMQTSYQLSARPELLFNLARLERELQRCEVAQRDYALYLKDVPQGRYRADAQQGVQELDRDCVPSGGSQNGASPAPAAPLTKADTRPRPLDPEDESQRARRTAGRIALGAGALLGAVAVPLIVAGLVKHHSLTEESHVSPADNDPWRRDYYPGLVLGIAGAGCAAAGAILLLLDPQTSNTNRASAHVDLQPGYIGAGYSRSF